MNILNRDVLLTTSGYQPFDILNVEDAIKMIYSKRARYIIQDSNIKIRSQKISMNLPIAISSTTTHSVIPVPIIFSKQNVIYRDDFTCQYCGLRLFSMKHVQLEHVIPKARWKKESERLRLKYKCNSFENCVTSCKDCNSLKRDLLPEEFESKYGLRLLKKPSTPTYIPNLCIPKSKAESYGWVELCEGQKTIKLIG